VPSSQKEQSESQELTVSKKTHEQREYDIIYLLSQLTILSFLCSTEPARVIKLHVLAKIMTQYHNTHFDTESTAIVRYIQPSYKSVSRPQHGSRCARQISAGGRHVELFGQCDPLAAQVQAAHGSRVLLDKSAVGQLRYNGPVKKPQARDVCLCEQTGV
jgi:hypothetical protein